MAREPRAGPRGGPKIPKRPLLSNRSLAYQGLLDDFDIGVVDGDLQIAEVGQAAGIAGAGGQIPFGSPPVAHAPFAWENPSIEPAFATLGAPSISPNRTPQLLKRKRSVRQLVRLGRAQVAQRNRAPIQLDQAQMLAAAIGAQNTMGSARHRAHLGPFHVAAPTPASTQLGDVGTTSITGDGGSLYLDAHSLWIDPPVGVSKFFTLAGGPPNTAVRRRNTGWPADHPGV
jgi:hypothetical protein